MFCKNSWEYPGYADHMGTPEDTVNYSLFLKEIRMDWGRRQVEHMD
jgi:hypothetical protein